MTRRVAAILLSAAFLVGILAGCGAPGAGGKGFKVGMVTDVGGLGDKSFNDAANAGLEKAKAELKATTAVIESKKQEDYVPNLSTLVDQGHDLAWAIGFLMTDATKAVAEKYKDKKFAIIDSVVELPNVASVVFKEEEGSFLMGILAAKASKSGKIGFVGGMDVPIIHKFEAGFKAGVKAINDKAEVQVIYTGAFDSPPKGKEAALTLYGKGVDVIFAAAGACGIGVIEAAKEKNQLAIGVDSDQNSLAPQNVLSSMMKRVDVAVYEVSKQASEGKFPGGKLSVLGLKEAGVGASSTTLWDKAPGAKELVDKWSKAIIDGKAAVPADRKAFDAWQVPKI